MTEYELVREIPNLCRNNQMRDVFFQEISTDDPVEYVKAFVHHDYSELTVDRKPDGSITVYVTIDNFMQKFHFTPLG